jgi:ABC-type uncharacterized transport system YnjBCD ATPase subunit
MLHEPKLLILELSAAMHGLEVPATMRRLEPLIARMRMAEDIGHYAEDYSRGMKKKLGLLLAMLHEPKLLILDEPTNGLDVESTHLFYDLIETTPASFPESRITAKYPQIPVIAVTYAGFRAVFLRGSFPLFNRCFPVESPERLSPLLLRLNHAQVL